MSRMFQSHETAKSLTWHAARKSIDGQMSHPADSPSWKLLDDKWPEFGNEPRNLRLALSSDGFNPHSSLRYKACPICGDDTPSHRLKNGHKICYIGHRKWLPINHPYRRQRAAFNGKPEYGIPPEPLTGEEVLHMVENVTEFIEHGVKTDLQPQYGGRRTRLPPGPWNLSRAEKREVPEGYSSNIKNLVSLQDSRLLGLKSHDCHTLMQQLLPVAIRSVLEKPARYAITRLCFFFNAICAKTVDVSKLDKLEEDVVVTLCLLEKYFPPSFFDIMVHLVVHLVREVRLCGPVYFRWMYPFERYMKVLKGYVQNRTRPEGCIAERYIAEEAVEFCTQHLSDVSTVGVPSSQKMGVSKPLSGCTVSVVDQDLLNQAHLYVLENTEEVLPYIEQHMIHIKTAYPKFRKRTKWLQDKHNSTFIQWLRFKVQSELEEDNNGVPENLRWLAAGPNMAVPLYRSYLIKGIKFNIKAQDDVRTTQNSGVYLLAQTMQVASAKDKNPILSNMGFYGVIQEIWDLDYQKFTIPVFRCDWIDSSGLVVDELGFTLVDLSKIGHRNDQFVLASQVKQIFFVDDPMHRGWSVVLSMPNREYNDVIGDEVLGDVIIECEPFTRGMPNVDTFDELVLATKQSVQKILDPD
ncbi:transposable element gene [Prunus dulcis]|uniref:Transposable element protein n=1 Tax=Prunus dulcis TaxID=3755 RepID=A0A4Y1RUU7_PRUDU|nr:transposable element gene [Prunus dulcis]